MSFDYYSTQLSFSYQGTPYTIKDIQLENAPVTENLIQLFARKKGTHFRVEEESGELKEISGWSEWATFQWNKTAEKEKVRKAIDTALVQFNEFLSRLGDEKVARAAVQYLFDKSGIGGIGRLGKTLYTHKLLKCDNILSRYLLHPNTVRLKFSNKRFVDITSKKFEGKMPPFPLQMELGDKTLNYNFWMLLKRKKGQIYRVDERGRLEKKFRFWGFKQEKGESEKVKEAVSAAIQGVNRYVAKNTMTEVHQLVIQRIFSSKIHLQRTIDKKTQESSPLGRMRREVFDRGAIDEGSPLEKLLNTELEKKRAGLVQALKAMRDVSDKTALQTAKRHVERAFMDLAFEEFEFTQRLGVDLERVGDGGSGGARYARNRFGKKILVIKPGDEGPLEVNNPQWYARLKRLLIDPKSCLEGNPEQMAEVDSWSWDRSFEIWSVPPTDVRFVASDNFVRKRYKECSVQMFVDGCVPLSQYTGISSVIFWLPRCFQRWYCGSRYDTGPFYSVGQRKERKKELMEKLPLRSMQRVGVKDFGTENIDCHPENILVKAKKVSSGNTVPDRLFSGDWSVSDTEISDFVAHLFNPQENGNQDLLGHLFFSEQMTIDGEVKEVTLITHDGGASNPHKHPARWDWLSLRNKHHFEVFPHFEEMFTEEVKNLVNGKDDVFAGFLLEKGVRNLRSILTPDVFVKFWSLESNRSLYKQWVFEQDRDIAYEFRLRLIPALFIATEASSRKGPYYQFYFNYHLKRIQGNLKTRIDSFYAMKKRVNSDEHKARDLFKDVTSHTDFKRELEGLNDPCNSVLSQWQGREVKAGELPVEGFPKDLLDTSFIFEGLGER